MDRQGLLPDLVWTPSARVSAVLNPLVLDGNHWLISKATVSDFVSAVQKTNQFAVRVVCTPREVGGGDERIVSISNASGITNMTLRAEGTNLVFWFRNELSVRRSLLAWYVPKVFDAIKRMTFCFLTMAQIFRSLSMVGRNPVPTALVPARHWRNCSSESHQANWTATGISITHSSFCPRGL